MIVMDLQGIVYCYCCFVKCCCLLEDTSAHIYAYTYTLPHELTVCTYYVHVYTLHVHTYDTPIYVCLHAYTYVHTCVYSLHVCMYVHAYTYVRTYIHICVMVTTVTIIVVVLATKVLTSGVCIPKWTVSWCQ